VKRAYRALLFLTALCAAALFAAAAVTRARVADGGVDGVYIEGAVSFTGIPFTAAPVGKLRLEPPAAVVGWSATHGAQQGVVVVKLAYRFGPLRPLTRI
jgi:hypothetical protein